MTTLAETIENVLDKKALEYSWIGKLRTFDMQNYPDALAFQDFFITRPPNLLHPTPLLKSYFQQAGVDEDMDKQLAIRNALYNAFHPIVDGQSLAETIGGKVDLAGLRHIGSEGLKVFENLTEEERQIASQLFATS